MSDYDSSDYLSSTGNTGYDASTDTMRDYGSTDYGSGFYNWLSDPSSSTSGFGDLLKGFGNILKGTSDYGVAGQIAGLGGLGSLLNNVLGSSGGGGGYGGGIPTLNASRQMLPIPQTVTNAQGQTVPRRPGSGGVTYFSPMTYSAPGATSNTAGTDTAGTDTTGTNTAGTDTTGTNTAGTDTAGTDTTGTNTAGTDTTGTNTAGTNTAGTNTTGTSTTISPSTYQQFDTSFESMRPADWNPNELYPADWSKYVTYPVAGYQSVYNPQNSWEALGKPAMDLLGKDTTHDVLRAAVTTGDISPYMTGMTQDQLMALGNVLSEARQGIQPRDPAAVKLWDAYNTVNNLIGTNSAQQGAIAEQYGLGLDMVPWGSSQTAKLTDIDEIARIWGPDMAQRYQKYLDSIPKGATGGLTSLAGGGRFLRGAGDGVSDSIPAKFAETGNPARLADGEFVLDARTVSEIGNGSSEAGARKLYAFMKAVHGARKKAGRGAESGADKHLNKLLA
jgi:hypothetical protein